MRMYYGGFVIWKEWKVIDLLSDYKEATSSKVKAKWIKSIIKCIV